MRADVEPVESVRFAWKACQAINFETSASPGSVDTPNTQEDHGLDLESVDNSVVLRAARDYGTMRTNIDAYCSAEESSTAPLCHIRGYLECIFKMEKKDAEKAAKKILFTRGPTESDPNSGMNTIKMKSCIYIIM